MSNLYPKTASLVFFEGVLNDDNVIVITDDVFKYKNHNSAKVKLTYYTFANEWGNHEHNKYFKTLENACKWYKKNMLDRVILQGAYWLTEGDDEHKELEKLLEDYSTALEKMTDEQKQEAIDEWESLTLYCELD